MPRRRLSAEQIRDSLLLLSGELDLALGGTLFTEGYTANDAARELYVVDISGKGSYPPFQKPRRSVYLPVIRNGRPEFATLFDSPTGHESSSMRSETTVPTQALFMMNSPFVRERAGNLVASFEHVPELKEVGREDSIGEKITYCYKKILGRSPNFDELARSKDFLQNYQDRY